MIWSKREAFYHLIEYIFLKIGHILLFLKDAASHMLTSLQKFMNLYKF